MKVILSGGGTLGPVIPLLVVADAIKTKYPDAQFIWVGTKTGPEREVVQNYHIPFFIIGAGKWRRYISLWNLVDIFKIGVAFLQSCFLILKERPDVLISAGGFVSVPLHWAGALFRVPAWVHQQDVRLGLANRLMFPFAKKITTALKETEQYILARKPVWLGNPARELRADPAVVTQFKIDLGIPEDAPVIFALGGGTGSASVNKFLLDALAQWPSTWHVIHLVGRERPHQLAEHAAGLFPNYHVFQFFNSEMAVAYAMANVVVARAGFSTLTELAELSKAAIILPMFHTHQEDNARYFAEQDGIIMLQEGTNNGLQLAQDVKELIENPERQKQLGQKLHQLLPRATNENILKVFDEVVKK